jgi:hypothetical protein
MQPRMQSSADARLTSIERHGIEPPARNLVKTFIKVDRAQQCPAAGGENHRATRLLEDKGNDGRSIDDRHGWRASQASSSAASRRASSRRSAINSSTYQDTYSAATAGTGCAAE